LAGKTSAQNIAQHNKDVATGTALPGSLTHGGYSRHFRKRYSDKRTSEGRALATVMANLQMDLGELSTGQEILLSRIKEKLITLMQIGKYIDEQASLINGKGELLPALGRNYLAFAESLRRDIQSLYDLVSKKRSPVIPYSEARKALEK
jgi:hypothetical protein